MENKNFIDLLNEYKAQERSTEKEHLYVAFDTGNKTVDDCQGCSDCCGSGNCCCDSLCASLCASLTCGC